MRTAAAIALVLLIPFASAGLMDTVRPLPAACEDRLGIETAAGACERWIARADLFQPFRLTEWNAALASEEWGVVVAGTAPSSNIAWSPALMMHRYDAHDGTLIWEWSESRSSAWREPIAFSEEGGVPLN